MIKFERSELGKKCGEENCIKLLLLTLQVLLRFLLAKDTICFFFFVSFFWKCFILRIVIGHPLFLDKHWCKQKSFDIFGFQVVVDCSNVSHFYFDLYQCISLWHVLCLLVISCDIPISVRWNGNDMCPRTFHQCYEDGVYLNGVSQIPLISFSSQWEISRILKWRYVSTIFLAIFWGGIPLHSPFIGLIYGRYLHFRILKFPLIIIFPM